MTRPSLHVVNAGPASEWPTLSEKEPAGFVMIVDDRPTARSLLMGLARSLEQGLHVECFADPQAALDRAIAQTPDLVISDYRMPGMDGIEFIRRLRAVLDLLQRGVAAALANGIQDQAALRRHAVAARAHAFCVVHGVVTHANPAPPARSSPF